MAHVQLKNRLAAPEVELLRGLRDFLPEAMIPTTFRFYDQLPKTVSGKINRRALPEVERGLPEGRSTGTQNHPSGIETSTVESLTKIWNEILGLENIDPSADFFALGGHSLLAAQLLARIQRQFGQSLPLSILLEFNTINKLAQLITANSSQKNKSLVTIRSEGRKKPIYLLPGGDGDVLYFRNLEKHLKPDRPLYGLQRSLVEKSQISSLKVEDFAAHYLTEILQLQPEGPYLLAGHSFGGYVAMEIARLLQEQGRKVAFLGLLDTHPPGHARKATPLDRIKIQMTNMRGLNARQSFKYIRERLYILLYRASRIPFIQSNVKWIKLAPIDGMGGASIASHNYNPEPYQGDGFLFEVKDRPWYIRWDPMENWQKYIRGKLEVRQISGTHTDILFEPYVQDLARQIDDCLQFVDA